MTAKLLEESNEPTSSASLLHSLEATEASTRDPPNVRQGLPMTFAWLSPEVRSRPLLHLLC